MEPAAPATEDSAKDLNLLHMLKANQAGGGMSNFLEGFKNMDTDGDGQVSFKELVEKFTGELDPSMMEKLGLEGDGFDMNSMKQVFGTLFGFEAMSMGAPLGEGTILKDELANTTTLDPETGKEPVVAIEPVPMAGVDNTIEDPSLMGSTMAPPTPNGM